MTFVITRTPYRISFFGGGSDYPEWYLQHGGAVLSSSINKFDSFQSVSSRSCPYTSTSQVFSCPALLY